MDIQIADASVFRRAVDALRDFLPHSQFRISEEGLRINGMDVSHVGFVDFYLSAKDCESIRVPKPVVIGVPTTLLSRVLATAGNAESLSLSYTDDRIGIAFKNDGRSATFEIPTLDIQEDSVVLPDMQYGAVVRAKSSDIAGVIKDLALFGDAVSLCLDEEGFHVRAEGDSGKGAFTLEPTDDRDMTLNDEPVDMGFALKYLQQIIKNCASLATYMEIAFDPAHPLRVTTRFGKESHFIAYLAPKVADDE